MQPKLTLSCYRFIFRAIEPVFLPSFSDPKWRSVFGLALRKMSCITDTQKCDNCIVRYQCDYSFLTNGPNTPPKKDGITQNMQNIPNPHVFHGHLQDYGSEIPPDASFSTGLILVGNGNERLPSVIKAMTMAGTLGMGGKRSQFRLLEVIQSGPAAPEKLIMVNQQIVAAGTPALPLTPKPPSLVRFSFQTPYLLPPKSDIDTDFDHAKLFLQIIRRISAMQEAYTANPVDADFIHLKSVAQNSVIVDADLTAERGYSYAGNRKKFVALRGSFILDLNGVDELWPWLYIGQWLHVGKMASKGFGRYKITVCEE